MELNEYQRLAARTINKELNKQDLLNHAVFGLASEAGEVASIMQHIYQGKPIDVEEFKKEAGDCAWFIAEACTALGLMLDDVYTSNIIKLMKRYPDGFDAVRSENRHSYGEDECQLSNN